MLVYCVQVCISLLGEVCNAYIMVLFSGCSCWSESWPGLMILLEKISQKKTSWYSKRHDSATITSWWFQWFFILSPIWGRWSHFDDHIFPRGWFNHQLDQDSGKSQSNHCNHQPEMSRLSWYESWCSFKLMVWRPSGWWMMDVGGQWLKRFKCDFTPWKIHLQGKGKSSCKPPLLDSMWILSGWNAGSMPNMLALFCSSDRFGKPWMSL